MCSRTSRRKSTRRRRRRDNVTQVHPSDGGSTSASARAVDPVGGPLLDVAPLPPHRTATDELGARLVDKAVIQPDEAIVLPTNGKAVGDFGARRTPT